MITTWFLCVLAAAILLCSMTIFFSKKKIIVSGAGIALSVVLGVLLWDQTQEPFVLFFVTALLLGDIALVLFWPMLDSPDPATRESLVGNSSWGAATSLWLLGMLGFFGLMAIWREDVAALLESAKISSAPKDPGLQSVAWDLLIPYLLLGGLILMGVSVAALLLFKAEGDS